jgi:hypothetical protein
MPTPQLRTLVAELQAFHPLQAEPFETWAEFLADEKREFVTYLIPTLLPTGVLCLVHGQPRAKESVVAFELARALASGQAPFGLVRFQPITTYRVLYIQEEDSRAWTQERIRPLVPHPAALHGGVIVGRGVNLDDPAWQTAILDRIQQSQIDCAVIDAARRVSYSADEGPGRVALIPVLRQIIRQTGATIVIVHHDTKPRPDGHDTRSRSQRASGGDWFAAAECPISVEYVSATESLIWPNDYKFSSTPDPWTMTLTLADKVITRITGRDMTPAAAEHAGQRGKLIAWLTAHPLVTRSRMRQSGVAAWRGKCSSSFCQPSSARASSKRCLAARGTVCGTSSSARYRRSRSVPPEGPVVHQSEPRELVTTGGRVERQKGLDTRDVMTSSRTRPPARAAAPSQNQSDAAELVATPRAEGTEEKLDAARSCSADRPV